MAVVSGPSAVTDGLVFSYDMSNTDKSWKGEPTVNIFGTNLATTTASRTFGTTVYNGWQATGIGPDNPRTVLFSGAISVSASTFYTFSCVYWSSNSLIGDVYLKFTDTGWPESNNYIQPLINGQTAVRNGSSTITSLGGGWNYCVGTFQTQATTTTLDMMFFDADIAGVQVFITNIQLEQKTYATPFVAGTRTNTQALLDQTNKNVITATSLTYASNNTFTFSSASNYAAVPYNAELDLINTVTLEAWLKYTTSANTVCIEKSSTNTHYQFQIFSNTQGSGLGGELVFMLDANANNWVVAGVASNDNNWHHVVGTYNKNITTAKIYIDGVLRNTNSAILNGPISNNQQLLIGSRSGASGFGGSIPYVKIYNRALSDSEVLQNYHSTKSRYGL